MWLNENCDSQLNLIISAHFCWDVSMTVFEKDLIKIRDLLLSWIWVLPSIDWGVIKNGKNKEGGG